MARIERGIFIACLVVLAMLIAGGTHAAGGSNLRKLVVFVEGTSWQVQQQVIKRSGSRVLNVLSLINGVAIQLPEQGTAQALSTLQADPTVEGVYDDPTIAAQGAGAISADGGGYGLGTGTNQAATHVTGTIALALQLQRALFFNNLFTCLWSTARFDGLPLEREGAGMIDAQSLANSVIKQRCPKASSVPHEIAPCLQMEYIASL